MNADEIQSLKSRLDDSMRNGTVRILTPLPRRVRVRLWFTHRIDGAGIWLVDHGHMDAAERLWRVCGLW